MRRRSARASPPSAPRCASRRSASYVVSTCAPDRIRVVPDPIPLPYPDRRAPHCTQALPCCCCNFRNPPCHAHTAAAAAARGCQQARQSGTAGLHISCSVCAACCPQQQVSAQAHAFAPGHVNMCWLIVLAESALGCPQAHKQQEAGAGRPHPLQRGRRLRRPPAARRRGRWRAPPGPRTPPHAGRLRARSFRKGISITTAILLE